MPFLKPCFLKGERIRENGTLCVNWASLPLAPSWSVHLPYSGEEWPGVDRKRPWRKEVRIQDTVSPSFLMQKERSALEVCPCLLPCFQRSPLFCPALLREECFAEQRGRLPFIVASIWTSTEVVEYGRVAVVSWNFEDKTCSRRAPDL